MTVTPRELILGPQMPLSTSWFDTTQITMARKLGEACPATPPTDAAALNDYAVHLQYYDLAKSLYIVHARTGDATLLAHARKAADSWWKHPGWISEGRVRLFPDSATPAPRHAGVGGLILRALDGRPEMWDWIVEYTKAAMNTWLKLRVNNPGLHNGVREGAFALHYAAWLAVALPDSYPLQAGGVATNGAQLRGQFLADVELVCVNYFGRLQQTDGSWRWDDVDVTDNPSTGGGDGSTLVGITQPFMVGLLLCALVDAHQIVTSSAVKESLRNQILKGCRHLYLDGPYRKTDPAPYDPTKRWRCFWYLYHGGTKLNPTKFAQGGWSLAGVNASEVADARQSIGPVVAAYGYAYKLSNDPVYMEAAKELWGAAYGDETDTIRNLMATDGKGFNQNCARAGSTWSWVGGGGPEPTPTPTPTPTPQPPAPSPSPDGTKAVTITDSTGGVWTLGTAKETLRNSIHVANGFGTMYKWLGGKVYVLGTNAWWYVYTGSAWQSISQQEPGTALPTRIVPWPKQQGQQNALLDAQRVERFFLRRIDGNSATFERVL